MTATPLPNDSALPSSTASAMRKHSSGFYGWWVVLASAAALFWGVPLSVYSLGVFLKPLMQEFHSGRGAISLAYALHNVAATLCAPLVGWLVGRFGSRRIIAPSLMLFALIFISMRFSSASIAHFYLRYLLIGTVGAGVGPIPYGYVISRWFDRRRGLALGLAMLGIGFGAIIIPALAQHLIAHFGWRAAYAILGSLVLCIAVPAVAFLVRDAPQDLGLLPDGNRPADRANPSVSPGLVTRDAWRGATFWLMVSAFFLVGASVQGCVVHAAAMLSDRGLSPATAVLGSSLLGAAVMIGRLATGYLLDRFFAPTVAAISFACVAAGIALFLIASPGGIAFLGAFLVGLGLGAELDIIPYLVSRYFGLRCFAQINSLALGIFMLAGAVGPLLMGRLFDLTNSYRQPLLVFLAATIVATLLMTRLGPYQFGPATHTVKPLPALAQASHESV